jgi:hypothetical protein
MKSMAITTIPLPVRGILKKLGEDMADARKRRRIATATMAQRAGISRPTLLRLERGDASVSVGIFGTVYLFSACMIAWLIWWMQPMTGWAWTSSLNPCRSEFMVHGKTRCDGEYA